MSTSGPEIFGDDLACDVRDSYRHLLEDRVPDDEATQLTIARWQGLDADEEEVFWLALAATQSRTGRLTGPVRVRALEVIDSGQHLARWDTFGPEWSGMRSAALTSLRAELAGPQPPRKTVRRPWRYVTDLRPGDVLSWTASTGQVLLLLRVVQVRDEREGTTPVLERLDWDGHHVPEADVIAALPRAPVPRPDPWGRQSAGPIYGPLRLRKRDPDWADVGLTLCGRVPARPGDEDDLLPRTTFLQWVGIPIHLEMAVTGLPPVSD